MRFTPQLRALDWLTARPIAHRGLHDKRNGVIENTSSAFTAAMTANYAIECDVQLTADGEAMVFHDETLDRLTSTTGALRAQTAKQLKAVSLNGTTDSMQTLPELLDQVAGRVPLIIELKSQWNGDVSLAQSVFSTLQSYDGPCAVMSFDPDLVEAAAALSPHTVRGITADRTTDRSYQVLPVAKRVAMRTFAHLARTRPHFVSFAFRELPFAPVQAIRAAGHPIITWTTRNIAQQSQALRYSDQVTFEGYAA